MQRRTALLGLGAGLTGLAFGAPLEASSGIPEGSRVRSVLEVFLCGGVSQYESFYCVPEHGASDGTHWHLFANTAELALDTALHRPRQFGYGEFMGIAAGCVFQKFHAACSLSRARLERRQQKRKGGR